MAKQDKGRMLENWISQVKDDPQQKKRLRKIIKWVIIYQAIGMVVIVVIAGVYSFTRGSDPSPSDVVKLIPYEEYDLKGLTVAEACEKARGASWKVDEVRRVDYTDKTDCYNTSVVVTNYDYNRSNKTVDIIYGVRKTKEEIAAEKEEKKAKEAAEKEAACVAGGKVYRSSGECKSAEEWAAQDKKEAAEAEAMAKAAAEASKQQSSNPSAFSSSNSSSSSSSRIDSSKSYKLATINDGEACPSNVQLCYIVGNSTGYPNRYGTMRGKVINNTGKDYSYIQVTASIYSSAGSKIGDCWGDTSGLKAGATWQFEAYCGAWDSGGRLGDIDITGW